MTTDFFCPMEDRIRAKNVSKTGRIFIIEEMFSESEGIVEFLRVKKSATLMGPDFGGTSNLFVRFLG